MKHVIAIAALFLASCGNNEEKAASPYTAVRLQFLPEDGAPFAETHFVTPELWDRLRKGDTVLVMQVERGGFGVTTLTDSLTEASCLATIWRRK